MISERNRRFRKDIFGRKKQDSAKHGWGLRIVEQIVGKYEGQIDYETVEETEEFRVRVWLNL